MERKRNNTKPCENVTQTIREKQGQLTWKLRGKITYYWKDRERYWKLPWIWVSFLDAGVVISVNKPME